MIWINDHHFRFHKKKKRLSHKTLFVEFRLKIQDILIILLDFI